MDKKGLGLYRQYQFSHIEDIACHHLIEWWLVYDGTIKISVGRITAKPVGENFLTIQPLIYREFSAKDHLSYKDQYIHALNYKEKLIKDYIYFKEQKKENPAKEDIEKRVEIVRSNITTNIEKNNKYIEFDPEKIARSMIKSGTYDFDEAYDMKNRMSEILKMIREFL